jgi:UDP-N-acetyl-D-galactosamine dehydrogenase
MNNYKICVLGLGYVGLPLAVAFATKFHVVGLDMNSTRIKELKNYYDKTLEVDSEDLANVKDRITFSTNINDAKDCNIYIIAVPTPIDRSNKPILTPLIESSRTVGSVINKNDIVIYESTVYPGVTEEVCVPELETSSNLVYNKDFFCGYSPERVNPGDKERTVTKIIKVTSGSTPKTATYVDNLYKEIITAGTIKAPTIKVAEASKVIENTQRDVNIALINELAIILKHMNIDTNQVIDMASTKWNFIKLRPGLVGGHCIGVDPYYLTHKSSELGYKPNLILAARQINNGMSKYIADQTIKELIKIGKVINNSNILILGVTFKEDCPDIRNTKVIDIIHELRDFGANVDVYDPWVNPNEEKKNYIHGIINNPLYNKKKYDAIIVAVAHKQFKEYTAKTFEQLSNKKNVIIDVKNIIDKPTWRL